MQYCMLMGYLLTKRQFYELSKSKAFADDTLNMTQIMEIVHDKVENIMGKGAIACYHHFLLFP